MLRNSPLRANTQKWYWCFEIEASFEPNWNSMIFRKSHWLKLLVHSFLHSKPEAEEVKKNLIDSLDGTLFGRLFGRLSIVSVCVCVWAIFLLSIYCFILFGWMVHRNSFLFFFVYLLSAYMRLLHINRMRGFYLMLAWCFFSPPSLSLLLFMSNDWTFTDVYFDAIEMCVYVGRKKAPYHQPMRCASEKKNERWQKE